MRKKLWQLKRGTTLLAAGLTALLAMGGATSAQAQAANEPTWGVVDFEVKAGDSAATGVQAANAISDEFGKQFGAKPIGQQVLMTPTDTVRRTIDDLGLRQPVSGGDIARLGQALGATTLITGEVINSRTVDDGGSKRAEVLVRVFVNDVASGIVINGAAVSGRSGNRNNATEASALYDEAFIDAAYKAVRDINTRNLPSATVLTVGLDGNALLNIGLQSGLKAGMKTIVTRGTEQVATGTIVRLDADSAYMKPDRVLKGISRADKVRIIFDVPTIANNWSPNGDAITKTSRPKGNNSGLITLVIVVLILFALFGGGRGGSQGLASNVTAEATTLANDAPAVRISFRRDAFLRGNQEGAVRFHIWRNDVGDAPVAVVQGASSVAFDDLNQSQAPGPGNPWSDGDPSVPSNNNCVGDETSTDPSAEPDAILSPGTPYQYSVQVVYRINSLNLPGTGTTGSSGASGGSGFNTTGTGGNTGGNNTTGTNTTGTNTTGTNTTGTNGNTGGGTTGEEYCYFISPERVPASGLATPLNRPIQRSPDNDATLTAPTFFRFTSVRGTVSSVQLEYVLQISSDLSFSKDRTINVEKFVDLATAGGAVISTPTVNTATIFPNNEFLFWRIGVRNLEDSPGPVAVNGERYIFSSVRRFRRNITPPSAGASN